MDKQIAAYTPTNEELEGLDNLISKVPELQELIENGDRNLDQIIKGIDSLKSVKTEYKNMIKHFFVALQQTDLASKIYKYSNFRNQEIIENLLEREKQYKEIIDQQAQKHNDQSGIEDMNKMFSTLFIHTKDNKKLSTYMSKTISNIKIYDDFKPIFEKEGCETYTKEELISMKKNKRRGPSLKDVDKITTINQSISKTTPTIVMVKK